MRHLQHSQLQAIEQMINELATAASTLTRVVIVDDSNLVRFSLNRLVSSFNNFKVDYEAGNGKELIDYLQTAPRLPEIIILDIGMPVMNGYETINAIKRSWPRVKVLVLSMYCQEYSINYMISKGANGFLPKDGAMALMEPALTAISNIGFYYSSVAPKELFEKVRSAPARLFDISEKQREVLTYIHLGYSNREIAEKMKIAKSTVDEYRNVLCTRLNLRNRSELVTFAIKNELV